MCESTNLHAVGTTTYRIEIKDDDATILADKGNDLGMEILCVDCGTPVSFNHVEVKYE